MNELNLKPKLFLAGQPKSLKCIQCGDIEQRNTSNWWHLQQYGCDAYWCFCSCDCIKEWINSNWI